MKTSEDDFTLSFRPRETDVVTLQIPKDVLASLNEIAKEREMPLEALIRSYIGTGLRQDLSRRFSERMFTTTEKVLSRHLGSTEEVSMILREIQDGVHASTGRI